MDFLNGPIFGPILRVITNICGNNFAIGIFVFTLFINVLLIPLTIKSQKSSTQQARIKPKLDALKKKYGDDKQKLMAAQQELYQKEKVSMAGGCLPMIFRLFILMSIYWLILSPVNYLTTVPTETIDIATTVFVSDEETKEYRSEELALISKIQHNEIDYSKLKAEYKVGDSTVKKAEVISAVETIKTEISKVDFNFFGIDLTETPHFAFNLKAIDINWIIPFLSFVAAMLSSLISMWIQKAVNPDAPRMTGMMLSMPLVSLFIAFSAPCGLGYYWACSSIISGGLQAGVQYFYGPYRMIANERSASVIKEYTIEKKTIDAKNTLGE